MEYAREFQHRPPCRYGVQLRPRLIVEAIKWCIPANGSGRFFVRPTGEFMFEDADTALAFKIRWVGAIPDDA